MSNMVLRDASASKNILRIIIKNLFDDWIYQDGLPCHHIGEQVGVRRRLLVKQLPQKSSRGHDGA